MRSICFFSAAIAFVALQLQINAVTASSLKDDPVTTCTSYDLSDKNFPGRGSEIEDDGTCSVTVPENPGKPKRKLEAVKGDDILKLEEFFGAKMERKLKNLPTSAIHHPSPINYEWKKGQPSPAEKYATAFGLDVKDFMDKHIVHLEQRLRLHNVRYPYNATSGYCIEAWYGLSHALAPASVLEKEPVCPVTFNGVNFHPIDIKGLITDIYDDVDELDYRYRDVNPGFFHIAATNLLGKLNHTFIIDRNPDYIVWNQPVYGFEVYEQTRMALKEAAQTFYHWRHTLGTTMLLASSTYADLVVLPDSGISYEYLLELDEAEELFGGEWLNTSIDNHPDFLWFPEGKAAADTVTSIGFELRQRHDATRESGRVL
ncbi:Transglutaminase elicitor [Phytophthora cactorum]|nr:Transglutaminase elicitor [Phytophthora cactorum]